MLEYICFSCENLEELDLQSCENIFEFQTIANLKKLSNLNLYRTKVNHSDLIFIISSCKNLEYLNIGSCNSIEDIGDVLAELSRSNLYGFSFHFFFLLIKIFFKEI